jgi:N-acetylmuramoyl-L-alanine amidase
LLSLRIPARVVVALVAGLVTFWTLAPTVEPQSANTYAIVTAESRRSLPFRTSGNADMVALEQVATLFGLKISEDPVLAGLSIDARGQRILVVPDQSFAQVAGQVRNLSAPVRRERNGWQVPIDFLNVVGSALNTRIEIRRASHLVIVGDLRIPALTVRIDRQGPNGRVVVDITPATPHRVTREGNRLEIRFDAHSLDLGAVSGAAPDFVGGVRVEGPTLVVALGGEADSFRTDTEQNRQTTVELLPPGAAPPTPPSPTPVKPPPPPATVEITTPGTIRSIAIDAGHGGEDNGTVGPTGIKEKDLTLQMARRLKASIESRIGLRVVLTRDNDAAVALDQRSATANSNKVDLFISLHANGAPRPDVAGAQVISLSGDDYRDRFPATDASNARVPVIGGGTRLIEAVPWELAQMPYVERSAALANNLVKHLAAQRVPLFAVPSSQLPLRVLVGANMPALQLEMGYLTNADEARALGTAERVTAIIEAIVTTINDLRRAPVNGTGVPADEARRR